MLAAVDDAGNPIPAESNFKSYYLESEAATDLFPSRAISIGRPNIVDLDAKKTFREASLIHSDKDVVESRKLGYSSFNRTIPSDMEIDTKSGAINFLANHQDSCSLFRRPSADTSLSIERLFRTHRGQLVLSRLASSWALLDTTWAKQDVTTTLSLSST